MIKLLAACILIHTQNLEAIEVALGTSDGRILSPESTRGVLLARPQDGQYGYVCDDGFSQQEARTACWHLGLAPARLGVDYQVGYPIDLLARDISIGRMYSCSWNDIDLNDCIYNDFFSTGTCGAANGVWLDCGSRGTSSSLPSASDLYFALTDRQGNTVESNSSSGIVSYRGANEGGSAPWKPLCHIGVQESVLGAMCSTMGYPPSRFRFRWSRTTLSGRQFEMQDLTCSRGLEIGRGGLEAGVAGGLLPASECSWMAMGAATEAEGDNCLGEQGITLSCDRDGLGRGTGLQFRLVGTDGRELPSEESEESVGGNRVAVAVGDSAPGFVCDRFGLFDENSGAEACASVFGEERARVLEVASGRSLNLSSGASGALGGFAMSGFRCSGSTKGLSDCRWYGANSTLTAPCDGSDGVSLTCGAPPADVRVQVGLVRPGAVHLGLRPSGSVYDGAVVARVLGDRGEAWLPVCAGEVAGVEAATMCGEAGFLQAGARWTGGAVPTGSVGSAWVSLDGCDGGGGGCNATRLGGCSPAEVATVRCLPEEPHEAGAIELALLDMETSNKATGSIGILAVKKYGGAAAGGTGAHIPVCADGLSTEAAVGACRAMGHAGPEEDILWRVLEAEDFQFRFRRLECPVSASSSADCAYEETSICASDSQVFLRCGAGEQQGRWEFGFASTGGDPTPVVGRRGGPVVVRDTTGVVAGGEFGYLCGSWVGGGTDFEDFVCYQMGFGLTPWRKSSSMWGMSRSAAVVMADLDCANGATSISQCTFSTTADSCSGARSTSCGLGRQAVDRGREASDKMQLALMPVLGNNLPADVANRTSGFLGARQNPASPFQPYCYGSRLYSGEISAFCNAAARGTPRFHGTIRWSRHELESNHEHAEVQLSSCSEEATGPGDCAVTLDGSHCQGGGTAFVLCDSDPPEQESEPLAFGLQPAKYAAVDENLSAGILRARVKAEAGGTSTGADNDDGSASQAEDSGWGYVCADGFTDGSARAVCFLLGYGQDTPGVQHGSYVGLDRTERFAAGRLECPAGATSLAGCDVSITDGAEAQVGCPSNRRVWVNCGQFFAGTQSTWSQPQPFNPPLDDSEDEIPFQAVDFRLKVYGRRPRPYLEPLHYQTLLEASVRDGDFGPVCSVSYINDLAGEMICEQMGYDGAELYTQLGGKVRTRSSFTIQGVQCREQDDRIDCEVQPASSSCGDLNKVQATCKEREYSDDEFYLFSEIDAARALALTADVLACIGAGFVFLGTVTGMVAWQGTTEGQDRLQLCCMGLAPFQTVGVLLATVGVHSELVAAQRFALPGLENLFVTGLVGLVLMGIAVIMNLGGACLACDAVGQSPPQSGEGDECNLRCGCILLFPFTVESVAGWSMRLEGDVSRFSGRTAGKEENAVRVFVFRTAMIRMAVFELPSLLLLVRVIASIGGWLAINLTVGLLALQVACGVYRVWMLWGADVAGSIFARSLPDPGPSLVLLGVAESGEAGEREGSVGDEGGAGGQNPLTRRSGGPPEPRMDSGAAPAPVPSAPAAPAFGGLNPYRGDGGALLRKEASEGGGQVTQLDLKRAVAKGKGKGEDKGKDGMAGAAAGPAYVNPYPSAAGSPGARVPSADPYGEVGRASGPWSNSEPTIPDPYAAGAEASIGVPSYKPYAPGGAVAGAWNLGVYEAGQGGGVAAVGGGGAWKGADPYAEACGAPGAVGREGGGEEAGGEVRPGEGTYGTYV